MNSPLPKQFIKLNNKPILLHSIDKFLETDPNIEIILVLQPDHLKYWEQVCQEFLFHKTISIANSGETRFHSVKNGLEFVNEEGPDDSVQTSIVAIHDAVRPLVSTKTILSAYKAAEMYGNAVPAVPINDSIRQIESTRTIAVDRSRFCVTQTPQCFRSDIIKKAYLQDYRYTFTDDAMVVEATGEHIKLVDGNPDNIKITSPKDLVIAEALLKMEGQTFAR